MSHVKHTFAAIAGLVLAGAPAAHGDYPSMTNVFPEDLQWANAASIPRQIELATVYGNPSQPGPYIFRARMPACTRLFAHRHPDERRVTVLR